MFSVAALCPLAAGEPTLSRQLAGGHCERRAGALTGLMTNLFYVCRQVLTRSVLITCSTIRTKPIEHNLVFSLKHGEGLSQLTCKYTVYVRMYTIYVLREQIF